jgi:hypothetical protein
MLPPRNALAPERLGGGLARLLVRPLIGSDDVWT